MTATERQTRTISYREAINEALRQEMRRDPTVILMGEDVTGASQSDHPDHLDAWGGVLGVTKGLVHEFGRQRVRDTPITESGFTGDGDTVAAHAMGSVEGFTLVLAGLKALLEHKIELNLVSDRFPDGL